MASWTETADGRECLGPSPQPFTEALEATEQTPSDHDDVPLPPGGGRRARRERGEIRPDDQIVAAALLAGTVVVSVLAIGAVHLPVLLVVAALAFGAAGVAIHRQSLGRDGLIVPLPALVCVALSAYTLLQIVPLPIRWLEVVAPTAADIWERALLPFGEQGPRWASLSLDPGASAVEALKWAVYGAVFTAAATVSSRHGASLGLHVVVGAAVLAALVTLGHGLADATRVYGLYQPEFQALAWHVGPLLNPNNLAGYLNLGAIVGLGLMLADRPHLPRWILGLGVSLVVGIGLTSASRAGVASLLVGVAALALFTRRRADERRGARGMSSWMLLAVVAAGGVLAVLGSTQKTWAELYDKDLGKLSMVLWVKPLVRDHAFFGVGRGAFESVFPVYRTMPGNFVYTHPENFIAQWAAEWGVPVALAALGAFAWAFAPRRMGAFRSSVAAGAWCGVGILLLQNLLDLGLEIPAVSIAAAATMGSLWGDRHRARTREGVRRPGPLPLASVRRVTFGVGAAGVALGILALALGLHDVDADRRAVHEAVDRAGGHAQAPGAARQLLHQAMLRHPAEPYFPLVGGMLAFHSRSAEGPIPWLQRSLERAQVNGRAHLLLAEVLAARGTQRQAMLELRLAVTDDPAVAGAAASLATRWTRDYEEIRPAVPEGKLGARFLATVASVARAEKPSPGPASLTLARRCEREAIVRDPDISEPRFSEASELVDALATSAPLCADRATCRARVVEDVEALDRILPGSWTVPTLSARLLVAEGKPEEAVKRLEGVCEQLAERTACMMVRVTAAARIKAPGAIDAASKDLLAATCMPPSPSCAEIAAWLAQVRMERGDTSSAVSNYERAAHEDSGNEARWFQLAAAAGRTSQHALALQALERVAKLRGGADADLQRRMDDERSLTYGGLLRPPR
jgi:hypothetical protein